MTTIERVDDAVGQLSISRTITAHAAARPDDPAVTCGTTSLTWSELDSATNRLARAYSSLGVRPDDLVTIALPNSVEFVQAAIAVWKLGATPQPVSHALPSPERDEIVALADSSLVVGIAPGSIDRRAAVPPGYEPSVDLSAGLLEDRIASAWKAPTSGGSTGRPKLILSTEPGVTGTARSHYLGQRVHHVQYVPGPLYHNGPFTIAAYALFAGNHLVISPRFSPEDTLATIERHAVTNVVLVPTMMHRIVRLPDEVKARYDLSSLETVLHMAAPCPAWLKEAWIDWIGAERIVEIYAATEGHASTMIRGDEWLGHRGSVGRCNLGEIQIVDSASGAHLPAGRTGEVAYRSGRPTYRYVGADARHFPDGWEGLGDIGWMDADGYLYLCDRQSDMILSGGANIYPAEIESALLEHPSVQTCAVIGLPHDDLGNAVHAVVQGGEADELRAYLAERLAPYKVPRTFEFVAYPVRDDAGKVRRRQLREERL